MWIFEDIEKYIWENIENGCFYRVIQWIIYEFFFRRDKCEYLKMFESYIWKNKIFLKKPRSSFLIIVKIFIDSKVIERNLFKILQEIKLERLKNSKYIL